MDNKDISGNNPIYQNNHINVENPLYRSKNQTEKSPLERPALNALITLKSSQENPAPSTKPLHTTPRSEAETGVACGKTIGKIEGFILKLFSKIPSFRKQIESYTAAQAKSAVEYSQKGVQAFRDHKQYDFHLDNATTPMKIPISLLRSSPEAIAMNPQFKSNKAIAEAAVEAQTETKLKSLDSGIGKMTPYQFDSLDEDAKSFLTDGAVTPTSYILGNKNEVAKDHLVNTYVIKVDGKDQAIIRSGKIDTEQKANEFVHLLSKIQEGIPGKPTLRVVSQQLNCFEREAKIINAQHNLISNANNLLQGNPEKGEKPIAELIHINVPSNRMVTITKSLEALGPLGRLLQKTIFKGERLSREQNLDSWGTYSKWVGEDLKAPLSSINNELKKIGGKKDTLLKRTVAALDGINHLSDKSVTQNLISECLRNIHSYKKELKRKDLTPKQFQAYKQGLGYASETLKSSRKQMRVDLEKDYKQLLKIESELEKGLADCNNDLEIPSDVALTLESCRQKVSLLRQVLYTQLSLSEKKLSSGEESLAKQLLLSTPERKLNRGQEGLAIQLLNDKLGVTAALNCKSGLDRTGFWHAVKLSLTKAEKRNSDVTFRMVNNWDKLTKSMNILMAKSKEGEFENWLDGNKFFKFSFEKEGARIENQEWGNLMHYMDENKDVIKEIIEFRKSNLDHLIRLGLPITAASTGVLGIKWGTGMEENLLPLNFLPPTVEITGGRPEENRVVQLIQYDSKTGEAKGLTPEGRELITKFQSYRGS